MYLAVKKGNTFANILLLKTFQKFADYCHLYPTVYLLNTIELCWAMIVDTAPFFLKKRIKVISVRVLELMLQHFNWVFTVCQSTSLGVTCIQKIKPCRPETSSWALSKAVNTVDSEFFARFYFRETSLRCFVQIKPSQVDEITLSFTDIGKSRPCREFLTSQIYVITLFAKIEYSQNFRICSTMMKRAKECNTSRVCTVC